MIAVRVVNIYLFWFIIFGSTTRDHSAQCRLQSIFINLFSIVNYIQNKIYLWISEKLGCLLPLHSAHDRFICPDLIGRVRRGEVRLHCSPLVLFLFANKILIVERKRDVTVRTLISTIFFVWKMNGAIAYEYCVEAKMYYFSRDRRNLVAAPSSSSTTVICVFLFRFSVVRVVCAVGSS